MPEARLVPPGLTGHFAHRRAVLRNPNFIIESGNDLYVVLAVLKYSAVEAQQEPDLLKREQKVAGVATVRQMFETGIKSSHTLLRATDVQLADDPHGVQTEPPGVQTNP